MYYVITMPDRQVIAHSEDPEVARSWAIKYGKETGERTIVVKATEFYAGGYRVPKKAVILKDFMA